MKNPSLKRLRASVKKVAGPTKLTKNDKKAGKSAKKKKGKKKRAGRGYIMRPSQPRRRVSKKDARKLLAFNVKLLKKCKFDSIQAAVNASGNNDRIVIMPGIYTEPESRKAPTNDPKCDGLE